MGHSIEGWKGDALLLQVQSAAHLLGPTPPSLKLESCIALPWPIVSALASLCFIWGSPSLLPLLQNRDLASEHPLLCCC